MIANEIITIAIITFSLLMLIGVYGRKHKSRERKLYLLLGANVVFAVSCFLYPFHRYPDLLILGLAYVVLDICALNKVFSKENPNQEQYNAWHDDPANWRLWVFYYNPKDTRIFPPKRAEGLGWTINFGNPLSVFTMLGMIVVIFVLMKAITG